MVKAKQLAIWLKSFAIGRSLNTAATLEEAAGELERLSGVVEDLPYRPKDLARSLILFRTSSNAHGLVNFQSLSEKVDNLSPAAKEELAGLMFSVAFDIDPVDLMRRAAEMRKAIEKGIVPSWPKDVELPK